VKKKIELKKPQYLVSKEIKAMEEVQKTGGKLPLFFSFLLLCSFLLSGLALWFVYQRYSAHS